MSKTIGILGGMGPLATADLFRKITCLTKASCDNDHIRVYIDSNARIPDRTAAILSGGTNPVPEMTSALRHLEACGADCIIMPCNTAHYFLPQLQAKTETPFLSMLAATAKTCAAKFPGKTAAILGTKGTLATGLYDRALEGEGVAFILPDEAERDTLMHLIYDVVKASKPLAPEQGTWEALLNGLHGAAHRGRFAAGGRAICRSDGGAGEGGHPFLRLRNAGRLNNTPDRTKRRAGRHRPPGIFALFHFKFVQCAE